MAVLLWTYADQQTIKPISGNFPRGDFEQIMEEVQVEDLQKLLGFDFYQDIIQNPDSTWNAKLLDGGEYEISAVTYFYEGLKYVLAYFAYARYVKISSKKDTATGFVNKQFEDSRQINTGKELNLHKDFIKIAFKYWEECQKFLNANPSEFLYYCTDLSVNKYWPGNSKYFCV